MQKVRFWGKGAGMLVVAGSLLGQETPSVAAAPAATRPTTTLGVRPGWVASTRFSTTRMAGTRATSMSAEALAARLPPSDIPARKDEALEGEMGKVIGWLDRGDENQKTLAADALRMAPEPALAVMRAALDGGKLSAEARGVLERIYRDQTAAREASAKSEAVYKAWAKKFTASYESIGTRDVKWDWPMRTLVKLDSTVTSTEADLWSCVKMLTAGGCVDPYGRLRMATVGLEKLTEDQKAEMVKKLLDSKWPASAKVWGTALAMEMWAERDGAVGKKQLRGLAMQCVELVPDLVKEAPMWRMLRHSVLDLTEAVARFDGTDPWTAWQEIGPKVMPAMLAYDESAAITVEGHVHVRTMNQYRGTGWASAVPKENWTKINEHLEGSIAEFDRAMKVNPLAEIPAVGKLGMLRYTDRPLEESEAAFREVMRRSPDSGPAVDDLSLVRMERWGGGGAAGDEAPVKLMALAQACALSRNYDAIIPQRVYSVLTRMWDDLPEGERAESQRAREIRALFRQVYGEAMKVKPTEWTLRMALAAYGTTGDFKRAGEAYRQLGRLGETRGRGLWGEKWPGIKAKITAADAKDAEGPDRPSWMP